MKFFFLYTTFFIYFLNFVKTETILKPSFFNRWNCIGVIKNIDFSHRPYISQIGELPLVTWASTIEGKTKYYTSINVCKHMGSSLKNGIILPCGSLQCPYHGLKYDEKDNIGNTIVHEGKLFWTAECIPSIATPPSVPFYNNDAFKKTIMTFDMEASLTDSAYNSMDIRHPEYVHNRVFGFGSNRPPTNLRIFENVGGSPDKIAMMFNYKSNRVVRDGSTGRYTENYHVFEYPTYTWSRVTFERKNHIIIAVNFLPISPKKTRWFVTICHNYQTSFLGHEFVKGMARIILTQDFLQMRDQTPESDLKNRMIFTHTFPDEEIILKIKNMFDSNYIYPGAEDAANMAASRFFCNIV